MSGIHIPVTADYKNFVDGMNAVRNSVRSTMDDVEKSGMSIEDTFNKIRNAAALSFAGFSGAKLIKDIANVRGEFQQLEVAFSTMLGSEEKATDLMNQLVKTAAITPFDLKGVADGAKSLMAYGTAAEDVNATLVRLGDIAAGMSIPLNDLVYLYGTTMVQGRMFTQDLRQFQGRGIPIAEELAKVLKTTKDQIPDLVTAGKVTSEVFNQAIVNMTSAGSKFGGLMEKQSKTINGQISNIQDSIDVMFNEIGKSSEGIINGALGAVSTLVENYETLGKILVDCAVAYGTYKAAVMAVAAMQSLQTAGVAALTTAEAVHYGWLVMVEKAQKLLNATMLSNPYVLVATALATLVATVVMFNNESESMGEIVEKANSKAQKSYEETEAKIKTEQQAIDELFDKLKKAEKGTNEYKETKDKILSQYGQYLQGLGNEIATLKDVEGAYKAVAAAARDAALARGKEAALSQVNAQYTQSYSDAMSKIYDVLEGKIGEKNAQKAIDIIKSDLKSTGKVAEDTQKTLHKYGVGYSLFGDLNKAEQVLISSTQKVNTLFGEQEKQVQQTAEKVTSLSDDYKAAEKNYRNAKNWLAQIEKNKADYTTKEYQEAVENLKAQKEAFEKVGGDPEGKKSKAGTSAAKEYNNRSAQQIEEELKHQEELAKTKQQALDAMEDARIAAIRNDSERERAEQDEQHKRNLRQIQEQADEMRKANYEHNKTVWENSHKDSPYELTEAGKAGWSGLELSQNQQSIITAQTAKENAEYNRLIAKRYDDEAQAYRELLREYGSFEEQKLAITQEYEKKIAEEQDPSRKASLMLERDNSIENLSKDNITNQIDWTGIFSDLKGHTKEYLEGLRDQLQGLISQGGMSLEDMTRAQEKIRDINELIVQQGDFFSFVGPLQLEYNRRLQEEADAKERLKTALEQQNMAETAVNINKMSMQQYLDQNGVENAGEISKDMKNPFAKDSAEYNQFNEMLAKLKANEIRLAQAREKTAKATTDAKKAEDKNKSSAKDKWDKTRDNIENSKVYQNVQEVPGLLSNLGLGKESEKAQKGLNGLNDAMGAATDFMTGNYIGALTKGVSAVMNFGEAFGVWSTSNRAEIEAANKKLADATATNTEAINRLTDAMDKQNPEEAYKSYKQALELTKMNEKAARDTLLNNARMYDGGHSLQYDFNDSYSNLQFLRRIGSYLGKRVTTLQELLELDAATLNKLYDDEKGVKLLQELGQRLYDTQDSGNYNGMMNDLLKYMSDYSKDAYDELAKHFQESVTHIGFETMYDNFVSNLMDMNKEAEDFAHDFEGYLRNAIYQAMLSKNGGVKDMLSKWYDNFAKAMESPEVSGSYLSKSEIKDLMDEYQRIKDAADKVRDSIEELGLYDGTGSGKTDKSATYSAAEKVTYDQMDEFTGTLRAVQIAGEQRLDIQREILYTLQTMSGITSPDNADVKEIRNLIGISNDYLLDIKRSNLSILGTVEQGMNNIINKLNALG